MPAAPEKPTYVLLDTNVLFGDPGLRGTRAALIRAGTQRLNMRFAVSEVSVMELVRQAEEKSKTHWHEVERACDYVSITAGKTLVPPMTREDLIQAMAKF